GEDEDEDGSEEPEGSLDKMVADDPFEETVEALDEPFQKVLRAVGNLLHRPRRVLSKENQRDCDDPHYDHRVGDRKAERPGDLDGLLRQAMFHQCVLDFPVDTRALSGVCCHFAPMGRLTKGSAARAPRGTAALRPARRTPRR